MICIGLRQLPIQSTRVIGTTARTISFEKGSVLRVRKAAASALISAGRDWQFEDRDALGVSFALSSFRLLNLLDSV